MDIAHVRNALLTLVNTQLKYQLLLTMPLYIILIGTPIMSTHQMADWHAMMVSLMWNVHAWRDWIQENIDRALAYQHQPNDSRGTLWLLHSEKVNPLNKN